MSSVLPRRYVMSIKDAAEYMKVDESEIRQWLAIGKLTRHRPGRFTVVDARELDALKVQSTREPADKRDLITAQEAAEFAHVAKRTIQRWVAREELTRYVRHPNRLMVSKAELTALLKPQPVD